MASVLELWRMQSILLLPLIPALLKCGGVVPDRVPFMVHIELFKHVTVCKQITVMLN